MIPKPGLFSFIGSFPTSWIIDERMLMDGPYKDKQDLRIRQLFSNFEMRWRPIRKLNDQQPKRTPRKEHKASLTNRVKTNCSCSLPTICTNFSWRQKYRSHICTKSSWVHDHKRTNVGRINESSSVGVESHKIFLFQKLCYSRFRTATGSQCMLKSQPGSCSSWLPQQLHIPLGPSSSLRFGMKLATCFRHA